MDSANLSPGQAFWIYSWESGIAWVGLFLVLGSLAIVAVGVGRRWLGHVLFAAALAADLVGLAVGAWSPRGFDQPLLAMSLLLVSGTVLWALNAHWRRPMVNSLGLALLPSATLWGLWEFAPARVPLWGSTLALEALAMGGLGALLDPGMLRDSALPESGGRRRSVLAEALAASSVGITLLALTAALWSAWWTRQGAFEHVITAGCSCALFALLGRLERNARWKYLAALALVGALLAFAGWVVASLP